MSLSNFKILQKLGEGSYAKVYKAQRISDQKYYAIKQIDISKLDNKAKQNTLNQIRFLASFQCRNIVKYYQAFFQEEKAMLCIVMEFAESGDLSKMIQCKKNKKEKFYQVEIWKAFIGVMHGLAYLHERNILHRDVKPQNIFVYNGDFKIGDLNVSKLTQHNLQQQQTQIGTPYYASPQIWQNCPYDNKCDVWALGCVAYQMAALTPPFTAKSMDKLYYQVTKGKIKPIPKHYSDQLATIIHKCLQKDASKRPSIKQLQQNFTIKMYQNLYYSTNQLENQKSKYLPLLKTIAFQKGKSMKDVLLPQANYQEENKKQYKKEQQTVEELKKECRHINTIVDIIDLDNINIVEKDQKIKNEEKFESVQQAGRYRKIFENGSFNAMASIQSQMRINFCSPSIQQSSIQLQTKRSQQKSVQNNIQDIFVEKVTENNNVKKQLQIALFKKLENLKAEKSCERRKTTIESSIKPKENQNKSLFNKKMRQHSQIQIPKYVNLYENQQIISKKLKDQIQEAKPILRQKKSNQKLIMRLQNQRQKNSYNPQLNSHSPLSQEKEKTNRRSLPRTELSAKKLQTLEQSNKKSNRSIISSEKCLINNENVFDYKNLLLSKIPQPQKFTQQKQQTITKPKKTIIQQLIQNQQTSSQRNNMQVRKGRPEEKLKQIQYQKQIMQNNVRNKNKVFINSQLQAAVRNREGKGIRSVMSYAYF